MQAITAGLTCATAGCTDDLGGGIDADHEDDPLTATETQFGYGGAATTAVIASNAIGVGEESRARETKQLTTDTEPPAPKGTASPTETPMPSVSPEDDLGEQGFGQYRYGG